MVGRIGGFCWDCGWVVSAVTSLHMFSEMSAAGFVLGLGAIISCSGDLFSQRELCVGAVF